jgi:hypothetical protein
MSTYYVNQGKRAKVGVCNICRKSAPLSWDHVPPKGGIDLKPIEQTTLFQRLAVKPEKQKYRISQNGVKYRTLCKSCNSSLGRFYDPVLNDFAIGVGKIIKSGLEIPSVIHYKTKPMILIKSILGHLLAAKRTIDDVIFDQKVRKFLFDDQANLPDDIKIFYWFYPYREIVVVRDVIMPAIRGDFSQLGSFGGILKYFPIAYLVCNLEQYEGLDELTIYRGLKLQDTAEIPIHLTEIRSSAWPEIDEVNFVAGGANLHSSVYAHPRKND